MHLRSVPKLCLLLGMLLAAEVPALAADNAEADFAIPAASLADALSKFGSQSGMQVVYAPELARGLKARSLSGRLAIESALQQLLEGTGLTWSYVNGNTVVLKRAEAKKTSSAAPGQTSAADGKSGALEEIVVTGIPEVLVVGSKILNMDIPRSRDDAQPYVIFDRATIEKSGAKDLEEFFKTRLTMNSQTLSNAQEPGTRGNRSQINLRGLGTNQTLILIDGHRAASPVPGDTANPLQSDLNAIPLAAIERIEILPSTASGIYGGGATGGVINVIRRRDYTGLEVKLGYDNTFESDAARRRVDVGAGFELEGGKTSVLATASYADSNMLLIGERDLIQRGRAKILANNPGFILNPISNPILGATPNIRSMTGVPLTLDGSGQSLDSPFTSVPAGYRGAALDGTAGLVGNAGRYNLDLPATAQFAGERYALWNAPRLESGTLTVRREFGSRVQAFVDLAASNNVGEFPFDNVSPSTFQVAADAPNNPFQQDLLVTVPFAGGASAERTRSEDRRGVAGVIVRLPGSWQAEADYTWNRNELTYSDPLGLNPGAVGGNLLTTQVRNGSIDVLRDTVALPPAGISAYVVPPSFTVVPHETTLKDATLRVSGSLFSLPGGPVMLSGLLERRDERYSGGVQDFGPTLGGAFEYLPRSQEVNSVYAEFTVPLFSARNARPAVDELTLQLAGRWDDYTTHGGTTSRALGSTAPVVHSTNELSSVDPMVSVRYQPLRDLALRASYGTGFVAPAVGQLLKRPSTSSASVVDPKQGNAAVSPRLSFFGGNPDLRPEESESFSAGIILTPRFLEGVRLSVDYTRIEKSDNIIQPTAQQVVDNEDALPGRVVRGPNPSIPNCIGISATTICTVDASAVNLATTEVEAYDVQFDYSVETRAIGSFDFFALATWQTHFKTQLTPQSATFENVGIGIEFGQGVHPLELKANAGLTWRFREWALGWTTRYFDGYLVADPASASNLTRIANQGNGGRIPSQIYHDFSAVYRFAPRSAGWTSTVLSGMELQLGIQNVFNKEPPFDASVSTRYYSLFGDPRLASYSLTLRKAF